MSRHLFFKGAFLVAILALGSNGEAFAQTRTRSNAPKNSDNAIIRSKEFFHKAQSLLRTEENPYVVGMESYGETKTLLKEDFSKLSSGTEAAPDITVDIHKAHDEYPYWFNVNPEYTNEQYTKDSQWGVQGTTGFPAGGTLYMKGSFIQLSTPLVDASAYEGVVCMRFRAKLFKALEEEQPLKMLAYGGDTNNMGPEWTWYNSQDITGLSTEWQTYEVLFYKNCGPTSIFIVGFESDRVVEVLIDDVELIQADAVVKRPEAKPFTDWQGTSFTLNWQSPDTPDHYLLSVWKEVSQPMAPTVKEYLLTDKEVTGTSYKVEGAESGIPYYYTLTAVKGEHKSFPMIPDYVVGLESPVLEEVGIVENEYLAKWSLVPHADVYNYTALHLRMAHEDGTFDVTKEDFTDVKDPDGNLSGFTKDFPDPNAQVWPEQNITELSQAGWIGYNYRAYTDHICVDAYHWLYNHEMAGIVSPELDLSKNGGKIKVTVKLAGQKNEYQDAAGKTQSTVTQGGVALFNYDETVGDFVQTTPDPYYFEKEVTEDWQEFTIEIPGGSTRSKIGIFGLKSPGNLYIDDLHITQEYKKGETLVDPYLYIRYLEPTENVVTIPEDIAHHTLMHEVTAFKTVQLSADILESNKTLNLESKPDRKTLQEGDYTGSSAVKLVENGITYTLEGLQIQISNPSSEALSIYTIDGKLLFAAPQGLSQISFEFPAEGAYILSSNLQRLKVLVR